MDKLGTLGTSKTNLHSLSPEEDGTLVEVIVGDDHEEAASSTTEAPKDPVALDTEVVVEAVESHEENGTVGLVNLVEVEVDGEDQSEFPFPKGIAESLNAKRGYAGLGGKGVYWTDTPDAPLPARKATEYPNSNHPQNLSSLLAHTVTLHGARPAFSWFEGEIKPENLKTKTWSKFDEETWAAAVAFQKLGAVDRRGICIQGDSDRRLPSAIMAAVKTNAVAVSIYETAGAEVTRHVANQTEASVIVVDKLTQAAKYFDITETERNCAVATAKAVVVFEKMSEEVSQNWANSSIPVMQWDAFLQTGYEAEAELMDSVKERAFARSPNECAVALPTSGTTGMPKVVMLSHENLKYEATQATLRYDINQDDRYLAYLTMAHVAGQLTTLWAMLARGAHAYVAGPDAVRGALADYLKVVRPTKFLGVPRVYEKMVDAMKAAGAQASFLKRQVVKWAKNKVLAANDAIRAGQRLPFLTGLARKITAKIPPLIGLDQANLLASGAAPIKPETVRFFESIGMKVVDLYGATETTGMATGSAPVDHVFKTVGKPLDGVEIRLADADEAGRQEILIRGPNIFMGYWGQAKKTAEVILPDGFYRTGDYGEMDAEGNLIIKGRMKELIKTSGGQYVAPVAIEAKLTDSDCIEQAVVIGEGRKFVTALLALPVEVDKDTGAPTDQLTALAKAKFSSLGANVDTIAEARDHDAVKAHLNEVVAAVNAEAQDNVGKIKKFVILPEALSVQNGTMTSTMKLPRFKIEQVYADLIDQMYEAPQAAK